MHLRDLQTDGPIIYRSLQCADQDVLGPERQSRSKADTMGGGSFVSNTTQLLVRDKQNRQNINFPELNAPKNIHFAPHSSLAFITTKELLTVLIYLRHEYQV